MRTQANGRLFDSESIPHIDIAFSLHILTVSRLTSCRIFNTGNRNLQSVVCYLRCLPISKPGKLESRIRVRIVSKFKTTIREGQLNRFSISAGNFSCFQISILR